METSVNNKCRAFTSLKQSKKLAEILPLESADMWYSIVDNESFICFERHYEYEQIPCWSLAALLGILPKIINNETLFIETSSALWHIGYRNIYTARADNPVDACCELILKLNELNLL